MRQNRPLLHYISAVLIMSALAFSAIFLFMEIGSEPEHSPVIDAATKLDFSAPSDSLAASEEETKNDERSEVIISFIGNCSPASMLGSSVYGTFNYYFKENDFIGSDIREFTSSDSLTVASCNAVLGKGDSLSNDIRPDENAWLLGPEENGMLYPALGIDAVSIETSHILDYTEGGREETKNSLSNSSVRYFDSSSPLTFTEKGFSVCILAARAAEDAPDILSEIRFAASSYDIVIVYGEAIDEGTSPSEWRMEQARAMIDAGADAVIEYTSEIQQIERYNEGIIAYSLGNFIDGGASPTDGRFSMILMLIIESSESGESETSFILVPCISSASEWIPDVARDYDIPEIFDNQI